MALEISIDPQNHNYLKYLGATLLVLASVAVPFAFIVLLFSSSALAVLLVALILTPPVFIGLGLLAKKKWALWSLIFYLAGIAFLFLIYYAGFQAGYF